MNAPEVQIGGRAVGSDHPVFVIAEVSANHGGDLGRARRLLEIAADAGADAVKLQTYRADSMTIDSPKPHFVAGEGTPWAGRTLYSLYEEAATPYEWFGDLLPVARELGLLLFSTPFDVDALEFLEGFDPPAYKIASFELLDLELIAAASATGKPVIMSTGMASEQEIDEAVQTATSAGAGGVVLLRCNSAYPAPSSEMDLRTIADMQTRWGVPVGLSDHTLDSTSAIAAVALGACVVEKHITERRSDGGPDSSFSLEPAELRDLVTGLRTAETALGAVRYGPSAAERGSVVFRRSLWVTEDVVAGDVATRENVRALRPAGGLPPKRLAQVLGATFTKDVERGTPAADDMFD